MNGKTPITISCVIKHKDCRKKEEKLKIFYLIIVPAEGKFLLMKCK
jgi:hypothetical protein